LKAWLGRLSEDQTEHEMEVLDDELRPVTLDKSDLMTALEKSSVARAGGLPIRYTSP
jgi:hypothetical protein